MISVKTCSALPTPLSIIMTGIIQVNAACMDEQILEEKALRIFLKTTDAIAYVNLLLGDFGLLVIGNAKSKTEF